jgi:2-polyprenyl-3-methyl-5-hydroxy-6-metoxy-1,4-benzoquinol methylase
MKDNIRQNIATYDATATKLVRSYNKIHVPDIFPTFVEELLQYPKPLRKKINVLNIGCGTGRDSKWIAEQGFHVVAIDGSQKMLELADEINNHTHIEYLCDIAPAMDKTRALKKKFDVILVHAFLFHLDEEDRQEFYKILKTLVKEECYVYITLRHGPTPQERVMFDISPKELETFATKNAFEYSYIEHREDNLGRKDVSWDHIVLKKVAKK